MWYTVASLLIEVDSRIFALSLATELCVLHTWTKGVETNLMPHVWDKVIWTWISSVDVYTYMCLKIAKIDPATKLE